MSLHELIELHEHPADAASREVGPAGAVIYGRGEFGEWTIVRARIAAPVRLEPVTRVPFIPATHVHEA